MCGHSRQREIENCGVAWRKRCVCWYEPVIPRRRDRCRCHMERENFQSSGDRSQFDVEEVDLFQQSNESCQRRRIKEVDLQRENISCQEIAPQQESNNCQRDSEAVDLQQVNESCQHNSEETKRGRCQCHIEGLNLQLTTLDDHSLFDKDPVIFDQILIDNSWYMNYDEDSGIIEIRKNGMYVIDWDVSVEDTSGEPFVRFGIEVDGEVKASATLPVRAGQLSGQALIHVNQIPTSVRLINNTGDTVHLSTFKPIANLRILSVE